MHWRLRSLRLDIPYVLLGAFIGWNSDVACSVKGRSMYPTLIPGDYVLFLPYTLLRIFQSFSQQPLIKVGDVVVMNISSELTVCKRVMRLTTDKFIMEKWNEEQFTEISPQQIPWLELENDSEETRAQREVEAYENLRAYARSRDWDDCPQRVSKPSAWLWLEGDNPEESFDSRNTGAMPIECLRGIVLLKVWPSLKRLPPR